MDGSASKHAALVAVDWGTTNRRGYLIGQDGAGLDRQADGLGLANVDGGGFRSAFDSLIAPWSEAYGALPALLSGMVGASTGWKEAPYCAVPVDIDELANNLEAAADDLPIWIVPGVMVRRRNEMPDVMRGEEVQAIGAATEGDSLLILPGTHSKWVQMAGRRIVDFKTFMTGDLHAAVLNHTVVSALAGAGGDPRAFERGVDAGRAHHGELTHILFGARSRVLFGELSADDVADYLSGLLIGAEIAAGTETYKTAAGPVQVVGGDTLSALYHRALTHSGIEARIADTDRIGMTYWNVAVRAGIVADEKT